MSLNGKKKTNTLAYLKGDKEFTPKHEHRSKGAYIQNPKMRALLGCAPAKKRKSSNSWVETKWLQ